MVQVGALRVVNPIEVIKEACEILGSQREFAKQAGVSDAYISMILSGKKKPSDHILSMLGIRRHVAETFYQTPPISAHDLRNSALALLKHDPLTPEKPHV